MGYDWKGNAEGGGDQAEKIPTGYHRLRVCKIVTCKSDGTDFRSGKGDPQIMLVFENPAGQEAAQMFTLGDKSAWTLAKLLSRCGVNLDRLNADGVQPVDFADRGFASNQLIGLEFWGHVEWSAPNAKGRTYSEIEPFHDYERTGGQLDGLPDFKSDSKEPAIADDDIPF